MNNKVLLYGASGQVGSRAYKVLTTEMGQKSVHIGKARVDEYKDVEDEISAYVPGN